MTVALCFVFFLSGAAALLFETLWFHQAGLTLGNGVWASSLVLAGFMAGLAFGNALVARYGARIRHPVRFYALLEVVIAGSGVALVYGLPHLTAGLTPMLRPVLEEAWIVNPIRLVIAFGVLAIPSTAMGATLPILVRALLAVDGHYGSALGRLYGFNTLGAVAGALAAELVFVEAVGIRGSAWVAAAGNGLAAIGAIAVAGRFASSELRDDDAPRGRAVLRGPALRLLTAAFLSGATLLALEVVWFRFLLLFINGSSLAFSVMLAVVLAGIAVGSLFGGAWLRRRASHHVGAVVVAFIAALLVPALYALFTTLPLQARPGVSFARVAGLGAVLMGPIAFLSGWLFTWIGAALEERVPEAVRATGLLTLANTLGSGLGSLLGGFVLLPVFGIEISFRILTACYVLIGLALWPAGARRVLVVAAAAAGVLALSAVAFFPVGLLRGFYVPRSVGNFAAATGSRVVAVEEGRTETIVLLERPFMEEPVFFTLFTNGHSMTSSTQVARRYMNLYAYFPRLFLGDPKKALLVSYGLGNTARALSEIESLDEIHVVDLSREILDLSPRVHPRGGDPLVDPRVRVHVEDGRYFLETTEERFDIITGEPPPPKNAGVVDLYTREYFRLVHDRLNEGGVHTYWLPVHNLTERDTRAILAAYCEVFADCTLWAGTGLDWMLVGSRGGGLRVTDQRIADLYAPGSALELREVGFEQPEQLGATFLGDAAWLRQQIGDEPPLTDDYPKRLETYAPFGRELFDIYDPWIDTDAARERFLASPWVAAAWPPALRDATAPWFDVQRVWNDWTLAGLRPPTSRQRFTDLQRLLDETELESLPLLMMGGSDAQLRVLEAKGRTQGADVFLKRGQQALATRRYDEAVDLLRRSWMLEPRNPVTAQLNLYALCRAGRIDEARGIARTQRQSGPLAGDAAFWGWLDASCGLADLGADAD